uniref:Monodehydroascorbate reductaseic n=1 Tax=Rhizophora mucronata TaxID=61149 RepID=A0A2P2L8A8_RHIMU
MLCRSTSMVYMFNSGYAVIHLLM